MRRLAAVALGCALGCTPRHAAVPTTQPLKPAPPPPPGSIVVWGPLSIEAVDVVRSGVSWDRDLVRASREVIYDVVLAQDRATCNDKTPIGASLDAEGCKGVAQIPSAASTCAIEPRMRARVEVTVTYAIDWAHRCAGDPNTWALPASGDARSALTTAGISCFRARNKLKPESSWTSLYELTELQIGERVTRVSTTHPRLLARLAASTASYCRDDGAYLDGTGGRPIKPEVPLDEAITNELALALARLAPTNGGDPGTVPLTSATFATEHALWEKCNAASAKESLVAQQRCLLLRQLDRFIRDVEDAARPETPKTGNPTVVDGGAG